MANISETSINRPVLSTVMMLVILLFGFIGYRFLGVREFPSVDQPVAEEQEDNQYDQEESLVNRLLYFTDRGPDKASVVIHHLDRDIFRQVFL